MVFSSLKFIFIFLPVFFLIYGLLPQFFPIKWFDPPKLQFRNFVLLVGSLVFYAFGLTAHPFLYMSLFILTILFNFIVGNFIAHFRHSAKLWLIFGIVFNFWWLVAFKYTGFIFTNLNHIGFSLTVKDIIAPLGISFVTFQNVSYLVDVYRRETKPEESFLNYGVYISMFPQLSNGPIVRYKDVADDLVNERRHTPSKIENGLRTFTIGLGYKVILADQIGLLWGDIQGIGFKNISTPLAWLGIIAFSFQLYFDFCGYSLMAMGLGELFGFKIPENFRHPYAATSMSDFWRRWHITLGSWFREYIYIPLGGNRQGSSKTVRNFFIVWLFTGIWHGASWNFVLWGLVLFGLIMLERFYIGDFLKEHRIVAHLYMALVIPLTWLLFAVTDMKQIGIYLVRLIPFIKNNAIIHEGDYAEKWKIYWKYFVGCFIFCTPLPELIYKKIKRSPITPVLLLVVFWCAVYIMYRRGGNVDPFLYDRF